MFSKMLTRIMVPYDGSKHADKALSRAMELAHNLESEIYLFTVINVDYISPPGMLGLIKTKSEKESIRKWENTIRTDAERRLKVAADKCQEKGITVSYSIARGNIANEILNFAKKKRISLIVIGSKGLHGIEKLRTLGSVSRRISEHSSCPVLLIR